jgi:hypothetical protein
MMPKWIWIPVYGVWRAIDEYDQVYRDHHKACQAVLQSSRPNEKVDEVWKIPAYGVWRAFSQYDQACFEHKRACQAVIRSSRPDAELNELWKWYDKSWPAMCNVLISMEITAGTIILIIGCITILKGVLK